MLLCVPASAEELTAPAVDGEAAELVPQVMSSFGEDLWYVVKTAMQKVLPNLKECCGVCLSVIAIAILLSVLRANEGMSRPLVALCGVVCISLVLLRSSNSLIQLGAETVMQISDYGKLLLPVLTAAMAAQGGTMSSAALYTATAFFDTVLSTVISSLLIPMVYIYIVLSIVTAAAGDQTMHKLRDLVKSVMAWSMKILLYVFTGYISITGAVSGTADQAAVKAAKLTISSAVPVIGSIMSDASETILVSAGVVKNSVGIYGLIAVVAIVAVPFLKIGLQYLLLKLTGSVCSLFMDKQLSGLLDDFSSSMGLLLAMTGISSLLFFISIVCFLKGMG